MKRDMTQLEEAHLAATYNLTDGYAHRPLHENERQVLDKLSELYDLVDRERLPELEKAYLQAFYGLGGQTYDEQKTKYLLLPNASISLEIVANFLRLNKLDLALIEPAFDNLANIFRRHEVPLASLADHHMEADDWDGILEQLKTRAICLVSPNNP